MNKIASEFLDPMNNVTPNRITLLCRCAFLALLLPWLNGCSGKNNSSGQPDDLSIPDKMRVLGSSGDQDLFVLRLRSAEYEMSEIVSLFRNNMKEDEWQVKTDSATDDHGGEIVFTKGDTRRCMIFISRATGKQAEDNSINVDIKCDR